MRFSSLISVVIAVHQVSCSVSVHNWWSVPDNIGNIKELISSIRVPTGGDPVETYYMANGFSGGYMGMQHNWGTERRILFSIWDDNKGSAVKVLAKGDGVETGEFGGEGTGQHGILRYNWKTGQTIYFKATADIQPAKNGTEFSGYYSLDEGKTWKLITTLFAENQLKWFKSPYGFLEDLNRNGDFREGYWGNFSLTTTSNKTYHITDFTFTHTTDLLNGTDYWMQKSHIGTNNEVYQRVGGKKSQGAYPPTNPPNYSRKFE